MNPEQILATIANEVAVCTKCALHESRKKSVAGEGPGFHENEQGRPFVGASGKFLDQLLAQAELTRADVFICNVVKCRPPENRDPHPDELSACGEYLETQIQAINPSIIVTLGRISMGKFFGNVKISAVHGQMQKVGERFVIPMFHPAAALHQPALKPSILADFAKLPDLLNEARAALGRSTIVRKNERNVELHEKPSQLSLF